MSLHLEAPFLTIAAIGSAANTALGLVAQLQTFAVVLSATATIFAAVASLVRGFRQSRKKPKGRRVRADRPEANASTK